MSARRARPSILAGSRASRNAAIPLLRLAPKGFDPHELRTLSFRLDANSLQAGRICGLRISRTGGLPEAVLNDIRNACRASQLLL